MRIVHLTPGAGGMYCGNCLRDNALVAAWRKQHVDALLIPLYLPLKTDEPDQSIGAPLFFGGINVYLQQQTGIFRKTPEWLDRFFDKPFLLKLAGRFAGSAKPEQLGPLTVSMLRGEEGQQVKELDKLCGWLKEHQPDWITFSNGMLFGMARAVRKACGAKIAGTLQGEDYFLDALPEPHKSQAWAVLGARAAEFDALIVPSRYYQQEMSKRLNLPLDKFNVVHNGINLEGYPPHPIQKAGPPVLGFFARICPEKGLETLVQVFIQLHRKKRVPELQLYIGGSFTSGDKPFWGRIQKQLKDAGLEKFVTFQPNLERAQKIAFYQGIDVLSVPATLGEGFGLYLLEAWASGVPVVQPRTAAFTELLEATGAGLLYEHGNVEQLAKVLAELLNDPERAQKMGVVGRRAVETGFTHEHMARGFLDLLERS